MDVVTVDSAAGEDVGDATSQRIDTTERGGGYLYDHHAIDEVARERLKLSWRWCWLRLPLSSSLGMVLVGVISNGL